MLRLGFDVDGVLADFRTAFHTAAKKCLRRDVPDSSDPDHTPSPLDAGDVRRVWDYILGTQNWWMEVPAYEPDQVARLYGLTRAAGWEVFFLTKRPAGAGDSVQFQTQWWIERLGFYLPTVLTVPGSRGEVANGLRLDLIVDDQIINCAEVISAAQTKALLMQRLPDAAARDHANQRGIGVVSTLREALTVIERLHDVLPHKRGRLLRLMDWFSSAESHTLPENPRAVRPIPPFDSSR